MKAIMVGIISFAAVFLAASSVYAAGVPRVVIATVQAGAVNASSQELVSIFNNTEEPVDITGWCLTNKSSIGTEFKPLACVVAEPHERVILPAERYAVLASRAFVDAFPETDVTRYDAVFESERLITASKDSIGLYDAGGRLVDELEWSAPIDSNKVWQRKTDPLLPTRLLDTSQANSFADFMKVPQPVMPVSGVEYIWVAIDICGNLADIQEDMPPDYDYDEAGNCEPLSSDVCSNLDLVQVSVPETLMADGAGACYVDACTNIDLLQVAVPSGYRLEAGVCVKLEDRIILITEILPNVSGADAGGEFVELYNPHEIPISLKGYVLLLGKTLQTSIEFSDTIVPPEGYAVFSDVELGVTLLNTTNQLRLVAPAGNVVSETSYQDPKDDESWALVDGAWQYTDQLTPGAANLSPPVIQPGIVAAATGLAPCANGKYRHPVTNRCRNIETDTRMLVACDADEYRNPETNRCRKTAVLASSLAPCREGYERNLETNRCRKAVQGSADLKPCQAGYERNPATNRCRKALKSSQPVPAMSAEAQAVTETATLPLGGALAMTVALGATGYGVYEWRQELGGAGRRALRMLLRR